MSGPRILGETQRQLLADIGLALLHIKNSRGLTLNEMACALGRNDESVAHYIAGESEMGVLAWHSALNAWPELADLLAETAADRAAKARQRTLDLNLTRQRNVA